MSGLFGKPSNAYQEEVYAGIQVSTSQYGQPITYVAGRQRVPFTLMWYGNFSANAQSSGGKGGSSSPTSYQYSASFLAALALGPIQGVYQIWHDKALVTLADENLALSVGGAAFTGSISGTTLNVSNVVGVIQIGSTVAGNSVTPGTTITGGSGSSWTVSISQTVASETMSSSQAIWSYLTSYTPPGSSFTGYISGITLTVLTVSGTGLLAQGQTVSGTGVAAGTTITSIGSAGGGPGTYTVSIPQTVGSSGSPISMTGSVGATGSQAIPYDHIAYVATNGYNLGSSAAMPNLTFEVEGVVPGYSDAYGVYDADPSVVIVDYLTNSVHGAGFGGTIQNLQGTTNTYQSYCMSLGLLTSPYEDTQRAATDFLAELLQITNSECFLSVGELKILPLADQPVSGTTPDGVSWSYTPNLTPVFSFTDDHYVPEHGDAPVKLNRKPLNDTHNTVNLEYLDRSNYYNPAPVNASIINDIALHGTRLMTELTFHQITNAQTALMAAQLILQADLYERNTYEFRVRQDFCQIEPLDYIALTDSGLGLSDQVCRVIEVDDDQDDFLTIKALEVPGVVRTTPQYNWSAAAGYAANYATAPGSVLAPAIFQMPPIAASLSNGITIGIAVAPSALSTFWLGCHVWMSVDGGSTYSLVGQMNSPARYGTITANLSAVADPDTTSTLAVALADTALQISTAVTHADADSNQTVILVGSGTSAEVMSFGAASLVSAGNYQLSYLRRGLYGSTDQAHTSGAQFVRIDGNIFQLPIDPGYAGQELYFKFTSFNLWAQAEEELSDVTAYSYTLPPALPVSGTVALQPRGNCALSQGSVYKAVGGAAAWDSDCVTTVPITSGYIRGKLGSFGNNGSSAGALVIGLTSSTASSMNPNTTGISDFLLYPYSSGATVEYIITEAGSNIGTFGGTPAIGDELEVNWDGFTVFYSINGVIVRAVPYTGTGLYAGVGEYTPAAVMSDVTVVRGSVSTPSQFVVSGTAVVNDGAIAKPTGANSWDSLARSVQGYGQCFIAAKPDNGASPTTEAFMVGLATAANAAAGAVATTLNYTKMNYGWEQALGTWVIWESGTNQGSFGTVSESDIVAVIFTGSEIEYYLNGVLKRTVTGVSGTFYGYCPMYQVGSIILGLRFGPGDSIAAIDTAELGDNAASQIASAVASGTTSYSVKGTAVNANIVSVTLTATGNPIGIDVSTEFQASEQAASFASPMTASITRDGTVVGTAQFDIYSYIESTQPSGGGPTYGWSTQIALIVNDTPAAGSHTYALNFSSAAGAGTACGCSFTNAVIKVREYKR